MTNAHWQQAHHAHFFCDQRLHMYIVWDDDYHMTNLHKGFLRGVLIIETEQSKR